MRMPNSLRSQAVPWPYVRSTAELGNSCRGELCAACATMAEGCDHSAGREALLRHKHASW